MNTTKQNMPLPNWTQYKIVPDSVIKEYLRTFYTEINWNKFCFNCQDYSAKVIRHARPTWTKEQIENFDIDCAIYIALEEAAE